VLDQKQYSKPKAGPQFHPRLFVFNTATGQHNGPYYSRYEASLPAALQVRQWICGAGHTTQAGARSTLLLHNGVIKGEVYIGREEHR
jgi:hypothetical protein